MSKPAKTSGESANSEQSRRPFYSVQAWACTHHEGKSEITAYVEASGEWETVLTVHPTSGASAETMAEYLLKIVNDHAQNRHMLRFALTTFEIVLDANGKLDFTSEQDVERNIAELKKLVG